MKRDCLFSVFSLSLLLLVIDIVPTQFSVGVKPGDWIRYDRYYYSRRIDQTGIETNFTQEARFDCLIEVLNVTGNTITFRESFIRDNGSVRYSFIYTADPSQPYKDHPEIAVHHYFIPANIKSGDRIPEPIIFGSGVGWFEFPPWTQIINDTKAMSILYTERKVNHIHWALNETGSGSLTGFMAGERESLFDRETGVMLKFYYNATTSGVDGIGRLYRNVQVHKYEITDTNLWEKPFWIQRETLTALIVVIISMLTLYVYLSLRGKI